MPISVVLGDDHTLVRQGLRRAIEDTDDLDVVGEGSNGEEIVGVAEETSPDIVVLDIRMPGMDGIEAAKRITSGRPETGVVMLTAYDDRHFVVEAVRAGARGYVLKTRDSDHLLQAVRLVAGGNMVIDPDLVVTLADELAAAKDQNRDAQSLTDRELEILRKVADGLTNAEIAERLAISEHTVKSHVGNILAKLQLADRTQAAVYAWRQGIVRRE